MEPSDVISHKIWNGSVFIAFHLSDDERPCDSSNTPPPFYIQVPRITYFPLLLEKVIRSLQNFAKSTSIDTNEEVTVTKTEISNQYWLSHNGIPLKWHYPVGVLFDLYSSSSKMPWDIDIHFKNYPSEVLLAPPVNRASIETFFVATLKEADQLKHRGRGGSGPVFDDIRSEEKRQLLAGFTEHNFDLFWSINKRFMQGAPVQSKAVTSGDANSSKDGRKGDGQCTQIFTEDSASLMTSIGAMKAFRHCPFRLYFSPLNLKTVTPTKGFIQTLISPFKESDRTPATFSDVIIALFGRIRAKNFHPEEFTFKVHGVEIPPETPAQWMCELMAYPDNFVHIVARKRVG